MKASRLLIAPLILAMVLFSPPYSFADRDEYDDSQSHPLRIVAYVAHPFGRMLEWFFARPFHAVMSGEPELEYIFGHNPHPPIFAEPQRLHDYGVSKRVPMTRTVRARVAPVEPISERVTVKEVRVERIVHKEVPKIVEVEKVFFPNVAFNFDSSRLTALGKGQVYVIAQRLKDKAEIVVSVEGHTDDVGTDEYNQRLGQRRAEMVMKELGEQGIDAKRLSVASFGESKPLIEQQTDWARAVNRRVEFRISAP